MSNGNYFNEKSTARFDFGVYRNHTAMKAGSMMFTISTRPVQDQQYSIGTTTISMSIREAQALQSFLNESLTTGASTDV